MVMAMAFCMLALIRTKVRQFLSSDMWKIAAQISTRNMRVGLRSFRPIFGRVS